MALLLTPLSAPHFQTNHLDIETIDALAEAINEFDGGVVLVSHDFRLIDQVAEEIWIVEEGGVEAWEGDIRDVSFRSSACCLSFRI